jgi:hypothetical protein
MQGGLTEEQVATDFLASSEYSALHPSDPDFVQSLYESLLGRQGASSEISGWTAALGAGTTRSQVVGLILNSTEAETRAVDGLSGFFLARAADPSSQAAWVTALQNGASLANVAAVIASSPGFVGRANSTVG